MASVAIIKTTAVGWQRTIGSRRALAAKLATLRVGMSTPFVLQTFGVPNFGVAEPPSEEAGSSRSYWYLRHAVLACNFDRGQVIAFTIVSRSPRFKPSLRPLSHDRLAGRLGKQTFRELTEGMPEKVWSERGASTVEYAESHYFGRPGGYCQYVLSASSAGFPTPDPPIVNVQGPYVGVEDRVEAYRNSNIPNTVTVATGNAHDGLSQHRALIEEIQQVVLSLY